MTRTFVFCTIFLAALVVVGVGCVGPATTRITSSPSGATISLNGNYVGETPLTIRVNDEWGQTTYTFTATKEGYRGDSKAVTEKPFEGPDLTVPTHIHFDLQPETE